MDNQLMQALGGMAGPAGPPGMAPGMPGPGGPPGMDPSGGGPSIQELMALAEQIGIPVEQLLAMLMGQGGAEGPPGAGGGMPPGMGGGMPPGAGGPPMMM